MFQRSVYGVPVKRFIKTK